MHRYTLRDDLSFCRIGKRLVFLDVGNDRYFRLPSAQEHSLLAYLAQDPVSEPEIDGLVERGLLVQGSQASAGPQPSVMPVARSAMETPIPARRPQLFELFEVLMLVLSTRLALKRTPLSKILGSLSAGAQRKRAQQSSVARLEQQLIDAASVFRHARVWVPVEMRCLLDSVALARFLRRRQLDARIVFGVALDPFTAHCWVQAGDLVLNDTVGNVHAHTPIRVV
ncbi:lasso peptide biosynthesis B2 protein [Xanthomonas hortorum]|uniref:Lasso peptide biosynthesis B2 protein n=1 Tax=Xanthomonas hortorum pv. pelargonii TaxID=453602 RepID=A0A6V7BWM7_9XANT|nr:lasso peptide biosynthesis B2 protein [Xanthomonas hortorum]MCE4354604.1 lasso peptide biosynthesis B2 protein [Xanthomonas hortorum pv. pelargonii]MCM5523819.1 lasso peptide biosynthesis B2 protein [Xanthomonas hortorum pv. pelargonii]MCM5536328.1 lasso peptide biosynthesis B2 protein [Xanthomonas hortorum pv. pelargonii]MCM5541629.1 lasso peptide biosynthesis B2 protein [Xanthomonas hortorum pv. pelargonii]MCM5543938.1 lasso peptide biosynthesis B2 protein [Xanthomonas hortorum pv. pelarg